ncbi:5-carboxymethyl-2-hydroxymuconate Delta-isomerase [Pseudomonas fulva]|nr:5-carboxymethyl-2-hydroxymuconate Delta-isomerase [Pseudomonas fulva]MBF8781206.1 5-carboxymethyl-2-hydroxymuconate Delta-isomerase [Pseudomonas fulva]
MPHLNLEYSDNLAELKVELVLLRLNQALVASGQFADELDIKSRAQGFGHFRVGISPLSRGFVHVRLAMLAGRSAEVKRQLSAALLEVLRETVVARPGMDIQLCAEILDIERESYAKLRLPAD